MLYILYGPDDFSLNQLLEGIKKGLGDAAALAVNTTTFDGQQVSLEQLRTAAETVPFLAEKRLVIINGLLSRFEVRRRVDRRRKAPPVTDMEKEYRSLATALGKLPESTVVVLVERELTNGNPLFREIASKAVVKTFPLLKDAQLRQWVQQRVTEEGGQISPRAAELLARLVGNNLWVTIGEIEKLLLYVSGRRIDEKDVRLTVGYTQQTDVFAMVDAIVEGKTEAAERLLQQLLHQGASPAYLLFMLSRQLRMIVRSRELRNQGKARNEIQNRLGIASEFALRKTLEQASHYSLARLKQVYRQLLTTDMSIKTGRHDGELALSLLVAELCPGRQTR